MVTRKKVIIALLELAIVAAVLAYAVAPRSLERATGGVYDRAAVTGVEVTMTAANAQAEGEAHRLTLEPGTADCDGLLDLLERRYIPFYLVDERWEDKIVSYRADIEITTETGVCTVSFTENDPIRIDADALQKPRIYRIWNGTFQSGVLTYLLELEEKQAAG